MNRSAFDSAFTAGPSRATRACFSFDVPRHAIASVPSAPAARSNLEAAAIAIDKTGLVVIATTRFISHGRRTQVQATSGRASGRFAKPQVLSNRGFGSFPLPVVAISSRDRAFVAWRDGAEPTVHWAASTAPGHFGRARRLGGDAPASRVRLMPGAAGAMLALVERMSAHWQLFTFGER